MKSKLSTVALTLFALAWGACVAQAGVLRTTAKELSKGSAAVAEATSSAAGNVADDVASAGNSTGGALKTAAAATGKGVAATPRLAVRGTVGAGRAIGRAIW
jgi:hypothetical protein